MPYEIEISFKKSINIANPNIYFNECCRGGDVVRDQLLPLISKSYDHIQTGQEDWGWFLWFRRGEAHLAVDIFCDDPETGDFRLRLYRCVKRFLFFRYPVDGPELEELRKAVQGQIEKWAGSVKVEKI
jgi:hypothetical protein